MSISRRQFILGTAAGLILPSYYEKVFSYFENHGEPLLDIPRQAEIDLFAVDNGVSSFQFHLGDPWAEPPEMTVREFALEYYGCEEDYLLAWGDEEEVDFDAIQHYSVVVENWCRSRSPSAAAHGLLANLDLGPDLYGKDAVGELIFYDCPMPGSDFLGVESPDEITISLLQKRLNDLNTSIRIVMA